MTKQTKPYFHTIQELYPCIQPAIYCPNDIEGVSAITQQQVATIRNELLAVLSDESKRQKCFKKHGLKNIKGWRQIELRIYGVDYPRRIALFPQTMAIINKIPGVSTVYFSALSARTTIAEHNGDTDAFYRVHIGLVVPSGLPECGFAILGEQLPWKEGVSFVFNDIYRHKAWNHTDQERIVLILDILRPEFRHQAAWVNTGVRATLYYSRLYEKLFFIIELLPRIITRLIRPTFHGIAYAWHRLTHLISLVILRGAKRNRRI